jgi:hypothetical protein
MKAWEVSTGSHPIDMFIVHAKQFAQLRDLHGTAFRFEFFNEVQAWPPKVSTFSLTLLLMFAVVQFF